jgi:hypothetical protein
MIQYRRKHKLCPNYKNNQARHDSVHKKSLLLGMHGGERRERGERIKRERRGEREGERKGRREGGRENKKQMLLHHVGGCTGPEKVTRAQRICRGYLRRREN